MTIGNNIKSITLSGTQTLNWADKNMENTLHHELMMIESIYDKKVVKTIKFTSISENTANVEITIHLKDGYFTPLFLIKGKR